MSEWIAPAASSAVSPSCSVQARVSFSPAVKNVIRSSASRSRRTTSSSAERAAVAERRGLLVGQLRELRLELQVDPAGPVDDRDQRLRRQRLELRPAARRDTRRAARRRPTWASTVRSSSTSARSFASPDFACFSTRSSRRCDVVAIGDEQLEPERLEVALRIGVRAEAARAPTSSASTWRRLPSSAAPVPGTSWTRIVAGVTFRACTTSASASSRSSAIGAIADVRLAVVAAARLGQRREERRLPAAGRADDADLECHGGRSAVRAEADAALAGVPLHVDDAPQHAAV